MSNASAIRTAAARTRADLGIEVVELGGFASRGHGTLAIRAAMWHDTVTGTNVSRGRLFELLRDGYVGLRGPIANVGLDRDGTLGLIAAGRAHHAGSGSSTFGVTSGNAQTVGIEVANRGLGSRERWTGPQYDVAVAFTAHLADLTGRPRPAMLGHLEWARGRKVDPWAPDLPRARSTITVYRRPAPPAPPTPPPPSDPVEEYLVSLTPQQRSNVLAIAELSPAEVGHLVSFARTVESRESSGRGVANAAIDDHRQRIESGFGGADYTVAATAFRELEGMGSSARSTLRAALAVVREARARGWLVDPVRFGENRAYGPGDVTGEPCSPHDPNAPALDELLADDLVDPNAGHGPDEAEE